ncbi:rhodanese-like domain-containing protein [Desulfococcaceae bacterium HSG9]|nr:rhodanese-like domain-containing protein [Desulfococcaceae bacterium HSG9]
MKYETDSWDVFDGLKNGEEIIVVDARSNLAYETEHIPGAINFPHITMSELTTAHLDKAKTYITYCDGIGCNGSTNGALKLSKLGFNVKELLGGIDWWKRDGYATDGNNSISGKRITD